MKFAIGTAQFKKDYGILKNNIDKIQVKKILNSKLKNIDFVDTALSYGNSGDYIRKFLNNKIKIITKIDKLSSKNPKSISLEIEKKVIGNFRLFKNRQLYCILFHDEGDAIWLKYKTVQKKISELKKKKYFQKIGVSCYNYKLIYNYSKFYKFDIYQIPLNIFNIYPKKIKELKNLKKKYNFHIHARSVFLQGVLLKKYNNLPNNLSKLKHSIKSINKQFNVCKKLIEYFLISSIDNLNIVDCTIVGITNYKELIKLSKYKKIKIPTKEIFKHEIKDKKLIDPRLW